MSFTEKKRELQLKHFEVSIYLGIKGKSVLFQSKDKYRGLLKNSIIEWRQVKVATQLPFILLRLTLGR